MSYRFADIFISHDNEGDILCFRLLAQKGEGISASFSDTIGASVWIYDKWLAFGKQEFIMFVCAKEALYDIETLVKGVREYFKEQTSEVPNFMFMEKKWLKKENHAP